VVIKSASNTLEGNFIGTDVNGTSDLGNFHGVFISDASGNTVGVRPPRPPTPSPATSITGS
jgi:hypothetical protein